MSGEEGGATPDPWAGDDIPASSGLDEIAWTRPVEREDRGRTVDPAATSEAPVDQAVEPAPPTGSRRWAIASLAVVVLVGAGLIWSARSDSGEQADTEPTTLPDLPDVSTPVTTAAPTTAESTVVETSPDSVAETATPSRGRVTTTLIELPPPIGEVGEPTELVGLTSDGRLLTLAVPSGILQTVQLRNDLVPGSTGGPVVATPSFTLVSLGGQLSVVGPDGRIVDVDPDDFSIDGDGSTSLAVDLARQGWIRRDDGTDVAIVLAFAGSGNGRVFTVDIDGVVQPLHPEGSTAGSAFGGRADGVRIVNDAGGSYRIDENGSATRVADGFTLATTDRFALQRLCDETLTCAFVVADLVDGTTTATGLAADTPLLQRPVPVARRPTRVVRLERGRIRTRSSSTSPPEPASGASSPRTTAPAGRPTPPASSCWKPATASRSFPATAAMSSASTSISVAASHSRASMPEPARRSRCRKSPSNRSGCRHR